MLKFASLLFFYVYTPLIVDKSIFPMRHDLQYLRLLALGRYAS